MMQIETGRAETSKVYLFVCLFFSQTLGVKLASASFYEGEASSQGEMCLRSTTQRLTAFELRPPELGAVGFVFGLN